MEFATIPFAYFFLVALTGTWVLARWRNARNAFLVIASWYFCWRWQPLFLAAVIASTVGNYAVGELLHRATSARRRGVLLVAGVATNLGFLGFFKYWNFFLDSLGGFAHWLGLSPHLPLLELIAPLGLSFYTFQAIAYLVDTARGTATRPGSLLDYALFVAFFPKFAAGPIVRSHQLLPQIMAPAPRGLTDVSGAVTLIVAGLAKKMVLGTYLATHMVEDAFQAPSNGTTLELWVALFAYTASIYLDFSGYTDIARGTAKLLGFELPDNFRYPYAARDIGDYWRRWHISFSTWLRDYVYFPLGGSRRSAARTYLNLVVTFLLCGLWHGPTWGFVLWGGLHGVALAVHKARRDLRRAAGKPEDPARGPLAAVWEWAVTLTFCALVRVFFKCSDLDRAWAFLRGLAGGGGDGIGLELGVIAATAATIALNFVGKPLFDAARAGHDRIPVVVRPLAWTAAAVILLTVRPYDVAFTIYFAF